MILLTQTLQTGLDARLAEFEAHVGEMQSRARGNDQPTQPDDLHSVISAARTARTESTVTHLLNDPAVALARREKFLAFTAQRSNSNQ